MGIKLTIDWDGQQSIIDIPDQTVLDAAKRQGYRETLPDPDHARNVELKQAEFLNADPNSPQRAILGSELQILQQQGGADIANPQTADDYAVDYARQWLLSMFVDQSAVQAEAQRVANEQLQAAKIAAATALGITL